MNDKLVDFMMHLVIIGEMMIGILWILISIPIVMFLEIGFRLQSVVKNIVNKTYIER